MTPKEYHLMIQHEYWANQLVIEQLLKLNEIPEKAKRIFDHVIGAQHVWIARIKCESPLLAVWPNIQAEHWDSLAKDNFNSLIELTQTPEQLNTTVSYKNSKGDEYTNPVYELIIHLCLHSQYHRGQVVTLIRDLVEVPIPTDMIAYLRTL
ncbi:MAG: DinB family protein [Flavobacteriales bacterium]